MKMKFSLLVVAGLMFLVQAIGAPGLPVGSQDELRQYALGQVTYGFRDVVAKSLVLLPNQPTSVKVQGTCAEDVLDQLFKTEILFGLVNTQDTVTGRVWLYDSQWNFLFFGNSSYKVGTVGKSGPAYNISLQPVPLLEGVTAAEILVLNEDGQTTSRVGVKVQNGQIFFEPWLCGIPNGILSVRFEDGTVSVFRLDDPIGQAPATIDELGSRWKIQGHYVVDRGERPFVTATVLESWILPTVLIRGLKEGDAVTLDVVGIVTTDNGQPVAERPLEAVVIDPAGKVVSLPMYGDEPSGFDAWSEGDYRIRFSWPSFGQPGRIYTGPVDGGGKG